VKMYAARLSVFFTSSLKPSLDVWFSKSSIYLRLGYIGFQLQLAKLDEV